MLIVPARSQNMVLPFLEVNGSDLGNANALNFHLLHVLLHMSLHPEKLLKYVRTVGGKVPAKPK